MVIPSCASWLPRPVCAGRLVWAVTLLAAVSVRADATKPAGRAARLGFTYDPTVRAAAQAEEKRATLELGPAEPGVVRLPNYEVVERPLIFTEDELLTPQGRVDLAKKRYLAPIYQKTIGPIAAVAGLLANPLGGWRPNSPEALALYYDDDMKRRNGEMRDLVGVARLAEDAKAIRRESRRKKAENTEEN